MKKYIEILKRTQLFSGISDSEISAMLNCLQARLLTFKKGEYVYREGQHLDHISVLVKGKLLVQHDDFWGNRNIINVLHAAEMFGEAYVAPESGVLHNDVIAEEDSIVITFNVQKILTVCPSACAFKNAWMLTETSAFDKSLP